MKTLRILLLASALSLAAIVLNRAADPVQTFQVTEIATIRWDGRDNSYVVRPNGKVERLKELFARYPRPENVDERSYYLTVAVNALSKEGYEFAGTLNDHPVMRRVMAQNR